MDLPASLLDMLMVSRSLPLDTRLVGRVAGMMSESSITAFVTVTPRSRIDAVVLGVQGTSMSMIAPLDPSEELSSIEIRHLLLSPLSLFSSLRGVLGAPAATDGVLLPCPRESLLDLAL